jgi:hypothetical protein
MSRAARLLLLGAFVLALLISLFFYQRINAPKGGGWWAGKNAVVRIQFWEPGKDMPTVSMTLPKKTLDRMVAIGIPSEISVGDRRDIDFRTFWQDLQRLPRGEKLRFEESDGTVLIWIEERRKGDAPADSAP